MKRRLIMMAEIVILVLICFSLFGHKTEFSFNGEHVELAPMSLGYVKPGAYTIDVKYKPNLHGQEQVLASEVAAMMELQSEKSLEGIRFERMYLRKGYNESKAKFWVKPGYSRYDDLSLIALFANFDDIEITSVEIRENVAYRWIVIIACIILFALINYIYRIFTSGETNIERVMPLALIALIVASSSYCFTDYIYQGHDALFHIDRLAALTQDLANGQFPHRIQTSMINGYGYITPLMYGEVFLFVPAILCLMSVPLYTSFQVYILMVNAITILIAYYCFKKMFGSYKYGLFAAFLMAFSSYRLTDVLTRSAVGEYTAFAFIPFVIYGFWKVYRREQSEKIIFSDYIPIVIGISAIIQSHILTCEMIAIFIFIFVLVNYKKTFALSRLWALIKSVVMILLINLWFIVPFVDTLKMDLNVNHNQPEKMQKYGLYLTQIFGVFSTFSGDNDPGVIDEMPLSLGFGLAIGLGMFICIMLYRKKLGFAKQIFWMGSLSIIFTLEIFPWDAITSHGEILNKYINVIQYPWRFLTFSTVFAIILTTYSIYALDRDNRKQISNVMLILIVTVTVIAEGYYIMAFTNYSAETKPFSEYETEMVRISGQEYLPSGTSYEQLLYVNQYSADTLPVLFYDNYHVYDKETGEEFMIECGDNNNIRVYTPEGYDGELDIRYEAPRKWRICEIISLLMTIAIIVRMLIKGQYYGNMKGWRNALRRRKCAE